MVSQNSQQIYTDVFLKLSPHWQSIQPSKSEQPIKIAYFRQQLTQLIKGTSFLQRIFRKILASYIVLLWMTYIATIKYNIYFERAQFD